MFEVMNQIVSLQNKFVRSMLLLQNEVKYETKSIVSFFVIARYKQALYLLLVLLVVQWSDRDSNQSAQIAHGSLLITLLALTFG